MTGDPSGYLDDARQTELARVVVKAAAFVVLDAALQTLDADGHVYSSRPCTTCRTISGLYGKPFGCSRMAVERAARQATAAP